MSKFEDSIKELIAKQSITEAKELIYDLSILYEQFHCLSRRLIYLLTGEEKSRTGLTDFVKGVFIRKGSVCQKEIMKEVVENFDPTISSKAVSDSLQYLMKITYLEKFWDSEIKKHKYRVPRKKWR
jgi:hypothetical protein